MATTKSKTKEQMIEILRAHIRLNYESKAQAERYLGLGIGSIHHMLTGFTNMQPSILDELGYDLRKTSNIDYVKRKKR